MRKQKDLQIELQQDTQRNLRVFLDPNEIPEDHEANQKKLLLKNQKALIEEQM